jgi:hypothetical protein
VKKKSLGRCQSSNGAGEQCLEKATHRHLIARANYNDRTDGFDEKRAGCVVVCLCDEHGNYPDQRRLANNAGKKFVPPQTSKIQ